MSGRTLVERFAPAPPLLLLFGVLGACMNPVHTDDVNALGDEVAGIQRGPTHRAGQPCTVCHGGLGPGSPEFVLAGTVYEEDGTAIPAVGVTVQVTDAKGDARRLTTNQVGNFYLEASRWSPAYPLYVVLDPDGAKKAMNTRIGRNGGCATCHRGNGDAEQMPAVYLRGK